MPTPRADLLLQEHAGLVWALCRRLDPEPEDAWQDACERLLRALPGYTVEGPASLRTWVTTVVHRLLVDRHRRRTVRGPVAEPEDVRCAAPSAEQQLLARREEAALEAAIAALPEEWRRVVVLHHVHGTSLEEIAHQEGVPIGTVKSRLHRARAALLGALS